MVDYLSYIYNLDIDEVEEKDECIFISSKKYKYLLIESSKNINQLLNLYNYVLSKNIFTYKILINIYNEYETIYDNKKYILIFLSSNYNEKVDFDELLFFNKNLVLENYELPHINWRELWLNKISYLNHVFANNKLLYNHLSSLYYFYYGLCDSLIVYFSKIKISNEDLVYSVCHRRIFSSNIKLNFYNPTNYLVDIYLRDIAEYIKSLYYSNDNYIFELEYFLKLRKLSQSEAELLFVRIIYPGLFFDYFETNDKRYYSKKMMNTNEYLEFIKKTYELICSYVKIPSLGWL